MKKIFPLLLITLLVTGCRREMYEFSFNAKIEQPVNTDSTKVYLDEERWIYWEEGDEISIGSDLCDCEGTAENTFTARLINANFVGSNGEDYNGVFVSTLEAQSSFFLGLHPQDDRNIIRHGSNNEFSDIRIYLPDVQAFRNDLTFARQMYPMVAWYGGNGEANGGVANLDFHALCGLVRLQIFNNTTSKNLARIEISSRESLQLRGLFRVKNYKTEDPYLEGLTDNPTYTTVTLDCTDRGQFDNDTLLTFYLILPALGGRGVTTDYLLNMKVIADDGWYMSKDFHVPLRRTGITNMKAMGVDEWTTGSGTGTGNAGLAGCGDSLRPFKVYDVADMQYLRSCYATQDGSGNRHINNQLITSDTWIAIMRSDIVLDNSNWTTGINEFVGHMTDRSHQSNPGITSTSEYPLFMTVAEGGDVDGITLKCGASISRTVANGVSPFCTENRGKLRNCVLTSVPGTSSFITANYSHMAGICVSNSGLVEGCRCEARMEVQAGNQFAGICMNNSGTLKGCHVSNMTVRATGGAAGICYNNTDSVIDCYFATSVTGSGAEWGGIVYTNSGIVEHCYLSSSGHIYTSKDVGGIVLKNLAGKVDYCWINGQLRGATAGGIVDSLKGGQVINCFNQISAMITLNNNTGAVGGLVGSMTDGSIENSYINDILLTRPNESIPLGGIVGTATGGTIDNCYSLESTHIFYGSVNASTTITNTCYLVDGTQTGVLSAYPTGYVALQNSLHTNRPSGGKGWQGALDSDGSTSGIPPFLEPYTVSSK